MSKQTTQDEIDKAMELKQSGYTIENISEELNRSVSWVIKYTKGIKALSGNKSKYKSRCKLFAEHNQALSEMERKLRQIMFIPVVFGGMNTNKM